MNTFLQIALLLLPVIFIITIGCLGTIFYLTKRDFSLERVNQEYSILNMGISLICVLSAVGSILFFLA